MASYAALAEQLKARFAELAGRTGRIETQLRAPLDADWTEQANQLEDEDSLEGVDDVLLAEMRQIQAALHRIDAGTYGECAQCGADIALERLEARPTATRCITCATS